MDNDNGNAVIYTLEYYSIVKKNGDLEKIILEEVT